MKYAAPILVALSVAACQPGQGKASGGAEVVSQTKSAPTPTAHIAVIEAFDLAERNDDLSAEDLIRAANILDEIGAKPWETTLDKPGEWRRSAIAIKPALSDTIKPFRGRTRGAAYRKDYLSPDEAHDLSEVFYAAEKAVLTLDASDSDLRFTVIDPTDDKTICERTVKAKQTYSCSWVPLFTAALDVRVQNIGDRDSSYLLVSN